MRKILTSALRGALGTGALCSGAAIISTFLFGRLSRVVGDEGAGASDPPRTEPPKAGGGGVLLPGGTLDFPYSTAIPLCNINIRGRREVRGKSHGM